jgi:nucleoside 2-deoxyribosyltransferase
MKLYLAGPMTGYPDHNFPAFRAAAGALREAGHDVVNPAELDAEVGTDHPWEYYMRRDIALLVECEGIALLPGWSGSRGARLEYGIARALGMRVRCLPERMTRATPTEEEGA